MSESEKKSYDQCCDQDSETLPEDCLLLEVISILGGKWKIPILYVIRNEPFRFSALQRALPGITQKMLTQCLRDLEKNGLVHRKVYPQVPPKVEYRITDLAKKLEPIMCALCDWAEEYDKVAPSRRDK